MANATGEAAGTQCLACRPVFDDPLAIPDQQSGGHNPTQVTTNKLLCIISKKMDIMTEDLLVKLCADFYGKNVI